MNKWLRKEAAKTCPIHAAVYDEIIARIGLHQRFEFAEILEALNYTAMADSIRWDYLVAFLKEDHDIDCVAVVYDMFKRHAKQKELLEPEKYVAIGHGKKAVGYVTVAPENAHLVTVHLKQRRNVANGAVQSFAKSLGNATAKLGQDKVNVLPLFPTPQTTAA